MEENKFETNYPTLASTRRSRLNLRNPFAKKIDMSNLISKVKTISRKNLVIGAAALAILTALFATFNYSVNNSSTSTNASGDQKIQLPNAKASQTLNKEFTFPIKDDKGTQISTIKFIIENVEKRDEIVVKGQPASAVAGRTFLILNLKIVNEYNQSIQISTKDYIRLTVNDKFNEYLAPDIHNDPVEVQAISTKFTRVGFPINDTDNNLKLQVGEIRGEKTTVDLNL